MYQRLRSSQNFISFLIPFCLIIIPIIADAKDLEFSTGEKTDAVLHGKVEKLIKDFHGDLGIYVRHLTTGQKDGSWEYDNEGFALIRNVSKLLWDHFEAESDWQSPADSQKWAK